MTVLAALYLTKKKKKKGSGLLNREVCSGESGDHYRLAGTWTWRTPDNIQKAEHKSTALSDKHIKEVNTGLKESRSVILAGMRGLSRGSGMCYFRQSNSNKSRETEAVNHDARLKVEGGECRVQRERAAITAHPSELDRAVTAAVGNTAKRRRTRIHSARAAAMCRISRLNEPG